MEFGDDLHEEGYLEKQGKLKFSWKKYWFVLRRDKLHYYKDPQNRNDAHAGLIDVCRAQSVRRCFQVHHGHAFEIVTKNRMHLLSADTAKACDVWVKKLQQAMQYERRNSVRLSHAHLEPQPS
ncbi:dual adapter for phosphotyrosine and 3-phosphotyrosine and 3-phosphoinositide-like, partial [Lingula anatina]